MVWKRDSDTVAFDPRTLAVVEHPRADHRSLNEVWGFFQRMMSELAQHPNDDGTITYAQALALASHDREQLELLWEQCQFAGLGTVIERDGRRLFQATRDANFVHVKTASEVSFEAQRKGDNSRPDITMPVRARDGDVCRYCGLVVWFGMKQGDRRGTYDHRPPGVAGSYATTVVACGSCNSGRGALSRGLNPQEGLLAADERYPLLDAPEDPYWTPETRQMLHRHAMRLERHGLTPPPLAPESEQPLEAGTPAPGAAAARSMSSARPATGARPASHQAPTGQRRQSAPEKRPGRQGVQKGPAESMPTDSEVRDGTGRDGPGRVGSGGAGPGRAGQGGDAPSGRRRGRRGGKHRGSAGGGA